MNPSLKSRLVQLLPPFVEGRNVNVDAAAPAPVNPDKAIRISRFFSYPKQVLYLLASFITLITLCHYVSLAYRYATRKWVYLSNQRTSASFRRLPVAVVDSLRALAFRWTIPIGSAYTLNLAEVGLAAGYIGVLLSWTFVNTTTIAGVRVEPHYYANRAGAIAASQLPIMTALGMRNNLISWLTGVSFDKLNFLHRMSARSICMLVWIHAGGRITIELVDDETIAHRWVQCGVLAITTLTLLCLLTLRPVRERSYELFLLVHFIFAFIFLLSIYFHLTGRNLTYYGAWPSMIVWGLDRFLRLVRLAVHNFSYLNPFSSQSSKANLDASVEVLSPHFLRVTMNRSKHFHWRPGQSAYLCFPSVSSFPFQSHPFTIAAIPDGDGDKKLTFLLRVRSGFTDKLLKAASPNETYKVFINGPYSSPPLLIGYNTVIFIAGGSGVAFTLPLLLDLISRAKRGDPSCQRVVFMWAIREADHIQWISDSLSSALEGLPSSISVSIKLYVTASVSEDSASSKKWDNDSNENDSEEKMASSNRSSTPSGPKLLASPFVLLEQGRPNLTTVITDEINHSAGRVSVNVCGTHALANAARKVIRTPRPLDVLRGGPTVTLHVEAFGGS